MVDTISSGIISVIETVENIRDAILGKIEDVIVSILAIPELISLRIEELLEKFFVPDEEALQEKLDALSARFAFINSINGYGEHLLGFLQSAAGTKAPVFTVDLGDYTGNYNWGSTVITIDFSWYAKYKPLVDNILAGIIWINWLWHMYKRIPELIHGQGMTTAKTIDIVDNMKE